MNEADSILPYFPKKRKKKVVSHGERVYSEIRTQEVIDVGHI